MTAPSQVPLTPTLSRPATDLRARAIAALGACVALLALWGQFQINLDRHGTALAAAWAMTRFFTNLTVALVAVFLLTAAAGVRIRAQTAAGVLLSVLVMALIYYLILAPVWSPDGFRWWVSQGLHGATPLAVIAWWIAAAPKQGLNWRMFPGWASYPLGYLAFSLARQLDGSRAPYPFLNLAERGPLGVLAAVLAITLLYAALAAGVMLLARRLTRAEAPPVQSDSPGSSSSVRP